MKRHEKGSGVLVVARETAKFSPKSLASSAAALRHGPASALAVANIKEADRGNITGVAKATAALVQVGLVKLCADTSENVAVRRKRMDVASALNIELDRIGRADAAAAVSSKLCRTGRVPVARDVAVDVIRRGNVVEMANISIAAFRLGRTDVLASLIVELVRTDYRREVLSLNQRLLKYGQVGMLADVNQDITARGDADVVAKACIDLIDAGSTSHLAEVVLVLARTDRAAVATAASLHVSRLDRPDDNAALIADLMKRGYVMEMCDVTLNLVKTEEGLLANGRAAAAMVQHGNTPLVTKLNVELAKAGHLDTVAVATAVLTADVDAAASADIAMEIVRQGEVKIGASINIALVKGQLSGLVEGGEALMAAKASAQLVQWNFTPDVLSTSTYLASRGRYDVLAHLNAALVKDVSVHAAREVAVDLIKQDKADIVADIAQALVDIQEADVVVQLGNAMVSSSNIPEATQLASTMASMKGATGIAGLLQEGGGQITTKVWESFLTKAEQASNAVAETAEQTSASVAQSAKEMSDKVF
ncbi:g2315 [Coccomyxa elongata]